MRYAMFRCCVTNLSLREYEASSDAVLAALGVETVDVREFGCCGYPLRNVDYKASMYSAARNFALAGKSGLDLLTACNCCFGQLKHAKSMLDKDSGLATDVAGKLEAEGLAPGSGVRVRHVLEVLHRDIGAEKLAAKVSRPLEGLRAAVHYGCHILRPSRIVEFDNPWNPSVCEDLVAAAGAECVDWDKRLDCCGAPLTGVFDDLSSNMSARKMEAAREAGAHCLLTVCPFCHIQLGRARQACIERGEEAPPVVLITQLLASALGVGQDLKTLAKVEA